MDELEVVYCASCKDRFYGNEDDMIGKDYYCSYCKPNISQCIVCGKIITSKYECAMCDTCKKEYKYFPNKWLTLRFVTFKRDNFTCRYCGRSPVNDHTTILHCDHIEPKSNGGEDELENLVTACDACNMGKMDMLLSKYQENMIKMRRIENGGTKYNKSITEQRTNQVENSERA